MSSVYPGNYNPQRAPGIVQAHIRWLARAPSKQLDPDLAESLKLSAMKHLREEYVHDRDFVPTGKGHIWSQGWGRPE